MRKKLNDLEIERAAKNAKATLEAEGLVPSEESQEFGKKVLRGEISEARAIEEMILKHTKLAERKARG